MKQKGKARMSRMLLVGLLGILMTWALPQRAAGGNIGEYANPSKVFTWYQKGPGCMHLSLKLFDEKQCNIKNAC
ncbi:MAG: hypothetical protein K6F94_05920, partial [Bacteroidaceae bacterium]|nr:hypothetical protein [Bacteroidaceae bacterium]